MLAFNEETKQQLQNQQNSNGSRVIIVQDKNGNHEQIAAYSTLNVIIYVIVALAFACIVYAMVRWCRGCRTGQKRNGEMATLELRVLHPLGPGTMGPQTATATTATTTVEYSAT